MASTPVKLKMLPRSTMKAKNVTRLVGQVTAGDGIVVNKANGNFEVELAPAATVDGWTFTDVTIDDASFSDARPIFILATGQSNFVQSPSLSWTPAPNLQVWNNTLNSDGSVGTAFVAPSATTINAAVKTASEIAYANLTRPVYLLIVAFSGQAISHWMTGTGAPDVFDNITDNISDALADAGVSTIDVLLWWQGRSDASAPSSYVANFNTVMARFQALSWFPVQTPVVIYGEASVSVGGATVGNMSTYWQGAANAAPGTRMFVDPGFLDASYWDDPSGVTHMTAAGYNIVGALAANNLLKGQSRPTLGAAIVDLNTGYVGFGAAVPPAAMNTLNANTGAPPTLPQAALSYLVGADATEAGYAAITFGAIPRSFLYRVNGTLASKTGVASGDVIATFNSGGWDTAQLRVAGSLRFLATETWGTTALGTKAQIAVVPNGTVSPANIEFPQVATTLVGTDTTNTFTNKTFDTAGTGNSFSINGLAATSNTGTGAVVRATSPTLVTPDLGTPSSGTLTNCADLPGTGIAAGTTWTPALKFGGNSTGMTGTFTGTITTHGSLVIAMGRIVLTAKGSSAGAATITGLPSSAGSVIGQVSFSFWNNVASIASVPLGFIAGSTISLKNSSATVAVDLTEANFTNTSDIAFVAVYLTN